MKNTYSVGQVNRYIKNMFTQDQLHRPQKDRFTCSGLTGQDIQSGTKFHFYFFYQCKIFHMQMS